MHPRNVADQPHDLRREQRQLCTNYLDQIRVSCTAFCGLGIQQIGAQALAATANVNVARRGRSNPVDPAEQKEERVSAEIATKTPPSAQSRLLPSKLDSR